MTSQILDGKMVNVHRLTLNNIDQCISKLYVIKSWHFIVNKPIPSSEKHNYWCPYLLVKKCIKNVAHKFYTINSQTIVGTIMRLSCTCGWQTCEDSTLYFVVVGVCVRIRLCICLLWAYVLLFDLVFDGNNKVSVVRWTPIISTVCLF